MNNVLELLGRSREDVANEMIELAIRAYRTRYRHTRPTRAGIKNTAIDYELDRFISLFSIWHGEWVWMGLGVEAQIQQSPQFKKEETRFPWCWTAHTLAVRYLNILNRTHIHNPKEFLSHDA